MDDEHVYSLFDVNASLLDQRCIVLCGNEEMYLMAYARAMVCKHFGLQEAPGTEEAGNGVFASKYHYEVDYSGSDAIRSIVGSRDIGGRKRVFVLRGVAGHPAQQQLKHVIDQHNTTFVVVSRTTGNIDRAILSRAMVLRLPFDRAVLSRFLERYGVQCPPPGSSVVCAVAKTGEPSYKRELRGLLEAMQGRGQLEVASRIKGYCHGVYNRCIPLALLCKIVVDALSRHPRITDVVAACAEAEGQTGAGAVNYEKMLVGVWAVLQEKF